MKEETKKTIYYGQWPEMTKERMANHINLFLKQMDEQYNCKDERKNNFYSKQIFYNNKFTFERIAKELSKEPDYKEAFEILLTDLLYDYEVLKDYLNNVATKENAELIKKCIESIGKEFKIC